MNKQRIKGAALIEFALVLPLLLAIVVGILYYGYAFVLVSAAQNAAKLGAEAAVSIDPLTSAPSDYEDAATDAAEHALDWLPAGTVSAPAHIGAPPVGGASASCQNVGQYSIVVQVTIHPNAGRYPLLPVLSVGGFQIPPGLDSDNGQPAVTASACAQL